MLSNSEDDLLVKQIQYGHFLKLLFTLFLLRGEIFHITCLQFKAYSQLRIFCLHWKEIREIKSSQTEENVQRDLLDLKARKRREAPSSKWNFCFENSLCQSNIISALLTLNGLNGCTFHTLPHSLSGSFIRLHIISYSNSASAWLLQNKHDQQR